MKRFLFFLLIGWLLLIFQTTLLKFFSVGVVVPNLVLLTVLYLGLYHQFRQGYTITFFLGYLMDLFSGGPMGLYIFLYLGSFFLTQIIREIFYLKSVFFQVIFILIFSLSNDFLLFLLLWVFSSLVSFSSSMLKWIALQGIYNASVGPFLFLLLDRVNQRFLNRSLLETT
jgi:rod shape-determining protein MreD